MNSELVLETISPPLLAHMERKNLKPGDTVVKLRKLEKETSKKSRRIARLFVFGIILYFATFVTAVCVLGFGMHSFDQKKVVPNPAVLAIVLVIFVAGGFITVIRIGVEENHNHRIIQECNDGEERILGIVKKLEPHKYNLTPFSLTEHGITVRAIGLAACVLVKKAAFNRACAEARPDIVRVLSAGSELQSAEQEFETHWSGMQDADLVTPNLKQSLYDQAKRPGLPGIDC